MVIDDLSDGTAVPILMENASSFARKMRKAEDRGGR
jgi:hypothetical protein